MKYRQIPILLAFLLTCISATSQNIDVKDFRILPNDQTARVHEPITDQNGEKCALIKVVTTEKGFVWEGGTLGITEVKKKAGEYWVYVPRGSKKLTIKHEELGVLRNYVYPEAIKESTVYEMKLTTGKVKTVVEEKKIAAQWLIIQTEPKDANVFIDDKLAGKTPFQRKYEEGEYTYRIEKSRYYNKAGKVTLKDEKKRLNFTLKPRFGNIKVSSAPENGMMIYLDDENTGKKTPATLEEVSSGEHTITLQSRWFQPQSKKVTVEDAQTATVNFELEKAYANITVQTQPPADILIDGEKKGNDNWQGRLMEGIYTIKAEKDKYYSQSEQLKVTAGEDETVSFDLDGKTGKADVVTTPIDAEVYLDGEKQGRTPLTLEDLLVGSYKLRLEKEGYGIIKKTLNIEEDETFKVNEELPEGREVNFTSQPEGAKLYIDGNYEGNTPCKLTLAFGDYTVKMVNGEVVKEASIEITQFGKDQFKYDVTGFHNFILDEKGINIKMVAVEGGNFEMGCTSEQRDCDHYKNPVHTVTIDDFYISKYEITNQQYADFLNEIGANSDGSYKGTEYLDMDHPDCQVDYTGGEFVPESDKENHPITEVTWYGANAFCEHYDGRLPTEAEWEFAARGGNSATATPYAGSDDLDEVAWHVNNSSVYKTHKVGTKSPNELGIYDMSGNAWEWCNDWYAKDYYSKSPQDNPKGPSSGTYRVLRGGNHLSTGVSCQVAKRYYSKKPGSAAGSFRFSQDL